MSHRRLRFYSVRYPEQLETRTMMAGNAFLPFELGPSHRGEGPAQHATTQFVASAIAGQSIAHERGFTFRSSHSAHGETSFSATLTDLSGTASGTAKYSTQTVDGEVETTFSVTIAGATAGTTFDVAIGNTVVGQLTTDDAGAGSLVFSGNPTGTEQELPADFPTAIGADTTITVGTLSGTLAADTVSGDGEGEGHGGCHHSSVDTSLSASLIDSDTTSAAIGTATYEVDGDSGDTTFSVSVTGATASTTLDVAIDNTIVGQLTTDETGAGSLVLSSNPSDTEQALPSNFPTNLSEGSTVTVGNLTGPLASTNTTTSAAFYFLGRRR